MTSSRHPSNWTTIYGAVNKNADSWVEAYPLLPFLPQARHRLPCLLLNPFPPSRVLRILWNPCSLAGLILPPDRGSVGSGRAGVFIVVSQIILFVTVPYDQKRRLASRRENTGGKIQLSTGPLLRAVGVAPFPLLCSLAACFHGSCTELSRSR